MSPPTSPARSAPPRELLAAAALLVGLVAVLGAVAADSARVLFLVTALACVAAATGWALAARPAPPRPDATTRSEATVGPAAPPPATAASPGAVLPPDLAVAPDLAVHLGRRAQSLISRQLEVLAAAQGGPAVAELGRLAARLRHNAESLLVAAGAEPPQRWRSSVAAREVARAAVTESDAVGRVRYQAFPDVWVVASSVGAVVHVLAELLDQAARASPPDAEVALEADLEDGALVVRVAARGVGLGQAELDEVNDLLAGHVDRPAGSPAVLGYLVAGSLAPRAGLEARLEGGRRGLEATLVVPAALLDRTPTSRPPADRATSKRSTSDRGPTARAVGPAVGRGSSVARPAAAPGGDAAPRPKGTGTSTGLERRVPGASWSEPPRPTGTSAFARRPQAEPEPHADEEAAADARRARLDRFSAGRATAEALIGLGRDGEDGATGTGDDADGQNEDSA